MKKRSFLLLQFILVSIIAVAQTEPFNYQEGVNKFKRFYNDGTPDSIFNMFSAQTQVALPLDKTRQVTQQLKGQLGDIKSAEFKSLQNGVAVYKTTFTNGVFALKMGFDANNKMTVLLVQPYHEESTKPVDPTLTETAVNINTDGASLSGSIIIPKNSTGKIPVVLIIAGSGATDRDGNSAGLVNANTYWLLAEALGKAGIATLRYDKRGIGKSTSTKNESQLRFNDFVNDAVAFIQHLKEDPRFSRVIVLGHSEGSLIGMIACQTGKVDGFISVAGAGDAASVILAAQLKNQPVEAYKVTLGKLDSLNKGLLVRADDSDALFRTSIQPYLVSWFKYNPQEEIRTLQAPVLIVQGTTDLQVSVEDAQKLKKAQPGATLVLVDGMNHVLKDAPTNREKNAATYNNSSLPVNSKMVDAVMQFVKGLK